MRLYDTRRRAPVDLILGHTVRMYVCGITPYDATHLGHAFTYSVFDVLARFLAHLGHRVLYTRNVTDVDDDILRKARELGVDSQELARREVVQFDAHLAALGLRRPDFEPRATQTVPAMLDAVAGLVGGGSAYPLDDGRVYFDTKRAGDDWGALSRLGREEMLRQFREKGGDPDAPGKRSPLDFLLWQPSAPDEPAWPSPWGPGRPGWHIECSVMAMETLGAVVDVHGGGSDLVFPHHEAEILQAEHLTGQGPFARAWLHVGMVRLDGVKMSKSLGNLVFVRDLLAGYPGGAVRRYLLERHYREDWDHDDAALDKAAAGYEGWLRAAEGAGRRDDLAEAFAAALLDNLDTPGAVAAIDAAASEGAGETVRELAAIVGVPLDGAYPGRAPV
jgi:L-cysteine:1D-myo-inositol 2-amino-2-deoxy-alpha-D-glucopyranoside ligase